MEYELTVPSEPVLVSQSASDPATDVIVQNLVSIYMYVFMRKDQY